MKLGRDYQPNCYKLSDRLWLLLEALARLNNVELGSCVFKLAPKYNKLVYMHTQALSLQSPNSQSGQWKFLRCGWVSVVCRLTRLDEILSSRPHHQITVSLISSLPLTPSPIWLKVSETTLMGLRWHQVVGKYQNIFTELSARLWEPLWLTDCEQS